MAKAKNVAYTSLSNDDAVVLEIDGVEYDVPLRRPSDLR